MTFLIEKHNKASSYYTIFTIHRLLLGLSVDLLAYSGTWSFWDRPGPGTWDLLLQWYSACAWTNVSLSNKIKRNYKELKITAYMHRWGKFWITRYKKIKKTQNPTTTSEELGTKAECCECRLLSTPPKGWANHPSNPSAPTPRHIPTPSPYKEPACPPPRGVSKGNSHLFSLPAARAGAPIKPCLNFLSGL